MGSSYIEFKGNGFWANDGAAEFWLYHLSEEINKYRDAPNWLREAGNNWRVQATAGMNGCVFPAFDKYLPSRDRVQILLELVETVLRSLKSRTSPFSASYLNSLRLGGSGSTFVKDVPTQIFVHIGNGLAKLLEQHL